MRTAVLALLLAAALTCVRAIEFDVAANEQKCMGEELSKDVLLVGTYKISPGYNMEVELKVLNPEQKVIYDKQNADEGKFAFTSNLAGDHQICFINKVPQGMVVQAEMKRRVKVDIKTGVEAKDYTQVAKREHLKPIEVQILKMQDEVNAIHSEMLYMRGREESMRNTNESTNSRVMWFSIFSLVILVVLGFWQIFYLKRFFQAKKLI